MWICNDGQGKSWVTVANRLHLKKFNNELVTITRVHHYWNMEENVDFDMTFEEAQSLAKCLQALLKEK